MFLRSLALVALFFSPIQSQADTDQTTLIDSLKSGGYVLYVRHAKTEKDYADQLTADPTNCATQRTLSESGWAQAKAIGAAIAAHNIPIGDVTTSQYCRAWQTADLAFGHYEKTAALNFEKAETYSPEQTLKMRNNTLPLLTKQPTAQTNTVIVGHDDPFEAATGIYPEPQGVMYILKPLATGEFEILGHIGPDAWPSID
jgi:broad specificity phosphatase PhoE